MVRIAQRWLNCFLPEPADAPLARAFDRLEVPA
jgi:hypothetical protein